MTRAWLGVLLALAACSAPKPAHDDLVAELNTPFRAVVRKREGFSPCNDGFWRCLRSKQRDDCLYLEMGAAAARPLPRGSRCDEVRDTGRQLLPNADANHVTLHASDQRLVVVMQQDGVATGTLVLVESGEALSSTELSTETPGLSEPFDWKGIPSFEEHAKSVLWGLDEPDRSRLLERLTNQNPRARLGIVTQGIPDFVDDSLWQRAFESLEQHERREVVSLLADAAFEDLRDERCFSWLVQHPDVQPADFLERTRAAVSRSAPVSPDDASTPLPFLEELLRHDTTRAFVGPRACELMGERFVSSLALGYAPSSDAAEVLALIARTKTPCAWVQREPISCGALDLLCPVLEEDGPVKPQHLCTQQEALAKLSDTNLPPNDPASLAQLAALWSQPNASTALRQLRRLAYQATPDTETCTGDFISTEETPSVQRIACEVPYEVSSFSFGDCVARIDDVQQTIRVTLRDGGVLDAGTK